MNTPEISVILPAFRTRSGAEPRAEYTKTVEAVVRALSPRNAEILLVVNGPEADFTFSPSLAVARDLARDNKLVRVIEKPYARGKGDAVQAGLACARGEYVFLTDIDLPYDLRFFSTALEYLKKGTHLVSADRRNPQSTFDVPVSLLPLIYKRHLLGKFFNRVVRTLFPISTSDTQAGIKAFSAPLARLLSQKLSCPGFLVDIEYFLVARENALAQRSLPIDLHLEDEKSTVRIAKEAYVSAQWLLRIGARFLSGHYRLKPCVSVLKEYSRKDFIFLRLREALTPYREMVRELPLTGTLLDIGSGHGLFAFHAAELRPELQINGVDHDAARVKEAQDATPLELRERVRFESGNLLLRLKESLGFFSAISAIDVLHYFSPAEQSAILQHAHASLAQGGVFIFREVTEGSRSSLRSRFNKFYEKIATDVGFTKSEGTGLTFRSRAEWIRLAEETGFQVEARRCSHWLFQDTLFTCRKGVV